MEKNLFAVIILYNPSSDNIKNIQRLSKIVDKLTVIDNSSKSHEFLKQSIKNINYHNFKQNKGLSYALNYGVNECLLNNNCKQILLLDQDSNISEKTVQILSKEIEKSQFKVLGPQIKNRQTEMLNFNSLEENNRIREVNSVITSGTIFKKELIYEVGFFDENLFIDYIDHEFCARVKSFGFKIGMLKNVLLQHNIGEFDKKFMGRKVFIHSNPLRKYYMIRNNIIYISRKYVPVKQKIKHLKILIKKILIFIIYGENPLISIQMILKAFLNSIRNYKNNKTPKWSF